MIENVIFDVDGTLVDSVDLHARSWTEAFQHFKHPVPFDQVRAQIGKGGDKIAEQFLDADDLREHGQALRDWRERQFAERYLPEVKAFPGVRELFQRLRRDGRRLALASSAQEPVLARLREILRVDDLLDGATSSGDASSSKPDPDIFQAALARLGRPPNATVAVVGDSPHDAEAAGKLGLSTIGLLCGGFPEDVLREAGCVATYRDPAHLLEEYASSPLASPALSRG